MDFTRLIEDALEGIPAADSVDRESAEPDGTFGAVLITLDDGRQFRVRYEQV